MPVALDDKTWTKEEREDILGELNDHFDPDEKLDYDDQFSTLKEECMR